MTRVKSDAETFSDFARGYVTESLYNWGKQVDLVRVFARQQTGFYNQSSSALKTPSARNGTDNATILDEVYIRLDAPLKAVMRVEYRDCVDESPEFKAYRCGISKSTYWRRLQDVIRAAERELLLSAGMAE